MTVPFWHTRNERVGEPPAVSQLVYRWLSMDSSPGDLSLKPALGPRSNSAVPFPPCSHLTPSSGFLPFVPTPEQALVKQCMWRTQGGVCWSLCTLSALFSPILPSRRLQTRAQRCSVHHCLERWKDYQSIRRGPNDTHVTSAQWTSLQPSQRTEEPLREQYLRDTIKWGKQEQKIRFKWAHSLVLKCVTGS